MVVCRLQRNPQAMRRTCFSVARHERLRVNQGLLLIASTPQRRKQNLHSAFQVRRSQRSPDTPLSCLARHQRHQLQVHLQDREPMDLQNPSQRQQCSRIRMWGLGRSSRLACRPPRLRSCLVVRTLPVKSSKTPPVHRRLPTRSLLVRETSYLNREAQGSLQCTGPRSRWTATGSCERHSEPRRRSELRRRQEMLLQLVPQQVVRHPGPLLDSQWTRRSV